MAVNNFIDGRDRVNQDDAIVYELIRENKSLMLSLEDAENQVVELKLRLMQMENGHLELVVKLENTSAEVYRLTLMLEDKDSEIGRLQARIAHHQAESLGSANMPRQTTDD